MKVRTRSLIEKEHQLPSGEEPEEVLSSKVMESDAFAGQGAASPWHSDAVAHPSSAEAKPVMVLPRPYVHAVLSDELAF